MLAFKTRQQELFDTKLKILRNKHEKKAKQENKMYGQKVKLTGKMNELGGLWVSEDEFLNFKEQSKSRPGSFFQRCIYNTTAIQETSARKQGSKGKISASGKRSSIISKRIGGKFNYHHKFKQGIGKK